MTSHRKKPGPGLGRIAYLCGEYPRATDQFIQREVAALRGAGVHVRTLSVRRPIARERPLDSGNEEAANTLYLVPASAWRVLVCHARALLASPRRYFRALGVALFIRPPGLRALAYQAFYFAEAGLVAEIMRRERLEHLHNHSPDSSGFVAMIAAEMGGFTYSMTLHGFGILSEPGRWRLREKLERALFTICISWQARSQAMLWCDMAMWPRIHVVHCGIDPDDYAPRAPAPGHDRLGFVGRLDQVKGLPVLLDALAELARQRPRMHLDIAGDGPQRDVLEAIVTERGLEAHVTFHGYLSQPAIRDMLQAVDVFVMSSLAEGIPVVLMEAMALGLPVVAPRIAGIPELVRDGDTGLLFTPGHSAELASAITQALDDTTLRARFADTGPKLVAEEFNVQTEALRLVATMRAYAAGRPVLVRPEPGNGEHTRES